MKMLLASTLTVLALVTASQSTLAQGQRTVEKDFSHSLSIEGTGKLTLNYKSLHWNGPAYESAKKNDQMRDRLNSSLWKRLGKLDSEFDFTIGGFAVPKGSYSFGINFDANDNFKLVLLNGEKETDIPLKTEADEPMVDYLTFDIRPSAGDAFVIEGRCGKFRATADIKVPSLSASSGSGQAK
ncbi:MAG TPA: hypothetical protein VEZ90_11370 [Blastocatellia bacterium]|nr:hypothetical protein [Blastocatellia bacterium]